MIQQQESSVTQHQVLILHTAIMLSLIHILDESEIQNIMRYGRSDIDYEYFAIIKAEIEDFVDNV